MNLLDKLTHSIKPGLAFLLIPFFFACNDPAELGLELEPENGELITEKVEFTLPLSTIYIDSLITDKYTYNLFGQYQDSISGRVAATSYSHFAVQGGTLPADSTYLSANGKDSLNFNGAYLLLEIDKYRGPGIITGEKLAVYEINDTIYNRPYYMSNRKLELKSSKLAEIEFDFNPSTDSLIYIPFDDEIGLEFYNYLKLAAANPKYKQELYTGKIINSPLAFVPGTENKGLYSLNLSNSDTTALVIQMISPTTNKTYEFRFNFKAAHYTYLDRDLSTGKLSDLIEEYTPSAVPSPRAYMDMTSGLYPKVDLTELADFIKENENIIINRTTLSFGSTSKSILNYQENVAGFNAFFVKGDGRINPAGYSLGDGINSAILSEGSYISTSQSLLTIPFVTDDVMYRSDVTLFSQISYDNYYNTDKVLTEEVVLYGTEGLGMGQTSLLKSEAKMTIYFTRKK